MLEMWVLTARKDPVVLECDHYCCNPKNKFISTCSCVQWVAHQVQWLGNGLADLGFDSCLEKRLFIVSRTHKPNSSHWLQGGLTWGVVQLWCKADAQLPVFRMWAHAAFHLVGNRIMWQLHELTTSCIAEVKNECM